MNNRELNREFMQKNIKRSGFTDSEDEDDKSQKSPKSGRSSLSNRSSLLSARSPRDEKRNPMLTTMRPGHNSSQNNLFNRRMSSEKRYSEDDDENELNSPRRDRFSRERGSTSPKSPKSPHNNLSDRSETSFNNNQRFMKKNINREADNSKYIRSPRSPRDDMMTTMRRPLNDNFNKNNNENGEFQMQKTRVATPTKLSMTQRLQNTSLSKHQPIERRNPSINQIASKLENDLEEEDLSLSGRTTPSRGGSRHKLNESPSPRNSRHQSPQNKHDDWDASPRNEKNNRNSPPRHQLAKKQSRSFSPKDSLNVDDEDEFSKKLYEKHTKTIDSLLNPTRRDSKQRENEDDEIITSKKAPSKTNSSEKDPQVVETLEDERIARKLQEEREQKRLQREYRAKNQTEITKKIEDAIEKVENTMEDSMRLDMLKEKSDKMKYETKPKLNETKLFEQIMQERKSRNADLNRSRASRTRSLSSSGNFDRVFSNKYANVKPKTQTRLPIESARQAGEDEFSNSRFLNSSKRDDMLNDSSSIRQNIYSEWYQKKMASARAELKEAQLKKRDEEERKAQEIIDKLQKSSLVFRVWSEKKEEQIKAKQKEKKKLEEKVKENMEEKTKKKEDGQIAYKVWLENKTKEIKEKKEDELHKERKQERQKRKESAKTENKKPPVPYDAWVRKKEQEIEEIKKSKVQKEQEKKQKEDEKRQKKKLAEKAFLEWLDKKEDEEINKPSSNMNRSLSASMASLPPFYPTSRTIPFGR